MYHLITQSEAEARVDALVQRYTDLGFDARASDELSDALRSVQAFQAFVARADNDANKLPQRGVRPLNAVIDAMKKCMVAYRTYMLLRTPVANPGKNRHRYAKVILAELSTYQGVTLNASNWKDNQPLMALMANAIHVRRLNTLSRAYADLFAYQDNARLARRVLCDRLAAEATSAYASGKYDYEIDTRVDITQDSVERDDIVDVDDNEEYVADDGGLANDNDAELVSAKAIVKRMHYLLFRMALLTREKYTTQWVHVQDRVSEMVRKYSRFSNDGRTEPLIDPRFTGALAEIFRSGYLQHVAHLQSLITMFVSNHRSVAYSSSVPWRHATFTQVVRPDGTRVTPPPLNVTCAAFVYTAGDAESLALFDANTKEIYFVRVPLATAGVAPGELHAHLTLRASSKTRSLACGKRGEIIVATKRALSYYNIVSGARVRDVRLPDDADNNELSCIDTYFAPGESPLNAHYEPQVVSTRIDAALEFAGAYDNHTRKFASLGEAYGDVSAANYNAMHARIAVSRGTGKLLALNDPAQNCVHVFSAGARGLPTDNIAYMHSIGSRHLSRPRGVAIDNDRCIVVADTNNDAVKAFTFHGHVLRAYEPRAPATNAALLPRPVSVCIGMLGNIAVVHENGTVSLIETTF